LAATLHRGPDSRGKGCTVAVNMHVRSKHRGRGPPLRCIEPVSNDFNVCDWTRSNNKQKVHKFTDHLSLEHKPSFGKNLSSLPPLLHKKWLSERYHQELWAALHPESAPKKCQRHQITHRHSTA
jgi:hypothetical protein